MSAQDPGSTGVAPRPPDSLEELYTEAQHALRAKEHERAAQLLRQILTADENFKDASRLLARLVRARRRRWYRDWRLAMMVLAAGMGIWLWRATPCHASSLLARCAKVTLEQRDESPMRGLNRRLRSAAAPRVG